ncbi:MAG: 5-formyltetrahydrofolate cyclo-ligase [Treponema sp.]|nr:5-formyltetrahydrofolate cyclo-ligase [Treponema sp.]
MPAVNFTRRALKPAVHGVFRRPAISVSKRTLRGEIKTRLAAQPGTYFSAQGAAAAALIEGSPGWEKPAAVFLFLSTPYEIDTSFILTLALARGKRVFVPRVAGKDMIFHQIRSAGGPWKKGPFGIPEPGEDVPGGNPGFGAEDFPALVIVPGLAFDAGGRRLGRGGAYYDRFLAELEAAGRPFQTMGLCTSCQLVPEVPVEDWDKNMDYICTGEELFAARRVPVPAGPV